MKRFGRIFLCLLLVAALCACRKQPDTPVSSAPVSDTAPSGDAQSSTSTTTTIGALVVTDTQGTVITNPDGTPLTTQVTALPTVIRPVIVPNGSTVTRADGTNKTEIVVPPHITVWTDAAGTIQTSYVPEQMATTATTTTTTTTTKPTQQEVTDSVSLPEEGYSPDKYIKLGAVSLRDHTVTMVIKNISAVWESEDGYFEYTCYDKNNGTLAIEKIEFGFIPVRSSKTCTFEIPENTAKVVLTDFQVEYWSKPV